MSIMKTYKLSPGFIKKKIVKTIFQTCAGIFMFIVLMSLFIHLKVSNFYNLIGMSLLVCFVRCRNNYKGLSTYEITLADESVRQKQAGLPAVEIRREDIVEIQEVPEKGLIVKSNNDKDSIVILPVIENYAEVRAQLQTWHEFTAGTVSFDRAGAGGRDGDKQSVGMNYLIEGPLMLFSTTVRAHVIRKRKKQVKALLQNTSWNEEYLKEAVKEIYNQVLTAWTGQDQDAARDYISERINKKHKMETDQKIANHQRKVLKNFNLRSASIVQFSAYRDNRKDSFWALIDESGVDYTIDIITGAVISGQQGVITYFDELWKFVRGDIEKGQKDWVLDEIIYEPSADELKKLDSSHVED